VFFPTFLTFVFFRLTLEINDAFHFLKITIFFDFLLRLVLFRLSWAWYFFQCLFSNWSRDKCTFGISWDFFLLFFSTFLIYYSLFSLQIIVFLRLPSFQIKFFSTFFILLFLWPTLNDSAPAVRLSSNAITLVYLNSFIFSWDYVLLRFSSLEISIFRFS